MSGRGRLHYGVEFTDPIDDLILTALLSPREAASLTLEEIEVLRATVRSEILFSDPIRKQLTAKAQEVYKDLKKAK
jgi:hypothetical protein